MCINTPPLINIWVKGRRQKVGKTKAITTDTANASNDNRDYPKQLEEENLKLRIEDVAFKGRSSSERTARVIHSLRREFKLKNILSFTGFPKATYMYWQNRFDRENSNQELKPLFLKFVKIIRILDIEEFMVNFENAECLSTKESSAHYSKA